MFIKSMIIDGFKSYGSRTEINGFDPFFNAITGLNGSGKSNILDGICFLLGITNLSQVRAANLHELVYKNGQAGITKATVSVTFDNTDKKHSPISYEQYDEITVTRQVVVGGRNKYLINGMNAQNSRVQDLFHSVQLNVNNPHFLIMQGRITKVLNMKPPEILSMIEEAAGTKMYESKKQSAQKTIEKKDAKLREIDSLLAEEIAPTLNKLKDERASYLEYQKIIRELEHLTKLWAAYRFMCAEESKAESKSDLDQLYKSIEAVKEASENAKKEIKELDLKITQLEKKKNQEGGERLAELEQNLKSKQLAEAKLASNLKNVESNIKNEEKKKNELLKNIDEDLAFLTKKEEEMVKMDDATKQIKETSEDDVKKLQAAQKRFQAASAGLSTNSDGEDATLADQLIVSKSDLAKVDTEATGAQMKLAHARTELAKKKKVRVSIGNHLQDKEGLDKAEKEVERLEREVENIGFDANREELMEEKRRENLHEVNRAREKLENLQTSVPYLSFDYVDPERNFDRRKVHGPLCNLFQMKDAAMATALEVTAGGKLFNIVVDDDVTAKKILERGQLKKRVTIIPLNKISARSIPIDTLRHAQRLVGENRVFRAIDLITYDQRLKSAMEFAFGSIFVCPDMNTAKRVAFDPQIQKVTVTFEGEVFNPSGTLTGGSRAKGNSILMQVGKMSEVKNLLSEKEQVLSEIVRELGELKAKSNRYHQIKQRLDAKRNEVNLFQQKLQQNKDYVTLEEIKDLETTIGELGEIVKQCETNREKIIKKIDELTGKLSNMAATRDKEFKDAEKEVKEYTKRNETSGKLLKEKENQIDVLRLEKEELQKGLQMIKDQMMTVDEKIKELDDNYQQVKNETDKAQDELKSAEVEVEQQKDLLRSKNQEIQELFGNQEKLHAVINENDLKITSLTHEASKHKTNIKECGAVIHDLTTKYEWINEEKKYFGQPNTAYDFNATNPNEAGHQLKKLREKKDKLSKNVNMGAMNMLSKAEEQYQDLMKKKRIVENDKSKIATVIKELDEKKNEALIKAWEQVNKDFGSIFSILLPGTQAKLVPPESKSVLDGLEVKVAFGDVWKESLTELSGGQRSLVALSLILSMLLFKPAPIYILDEVDAALDLSHTQNIGQMLRTHFRHSQFVVVSLKDGMFNNANILFKTKFVDGMSTVSRLAQRK